MFVLTILFTIVLKLEFSTMNNYIQTTMVVDTCVLISMYFLISMKGVLEGKKTRPVGARPPPRHCVVGRRPPLTQVEKPPNPYPTRTQRHCNLYEIGPALDWNRMDDTIFFNVQINCANPSQQICPGRGSNLGWRGAMRTAGSAGLAFAGGVLECRRDFATTPLFCT